VHVLRRPRLALLAAALLALAIPARPGAVAAAPRRASEYDLKAAFLLNFTHFVDWPPESFARADAPFELCVLGADPFDGALDDLVRGETVNGHPIAVRRAARAGDAGGCHLLFLSRQQDARTLRDVPGMRDGAMLAVGESDDFLADGGLLRFVLQEGRVRLQVSTAALQATKLKISSKLLHLCEPVTAPGSER